MQTQRKCQNYPAIAMVKKTGGLAGFTAAHGVSVFVCFII